MALAGTAWGLYSLRGRSARDPLAETAGNFARAPPFAAAGGVALLGETVTLRFVAAAAAILGGVGLALSGRLRPVRNRPGAG